MTRRRPPPRPPSKSGVKAAADRAEKRAKGEDVDEPKVPITPKIERAVVDPDEPSPRAGVGGRPTAYRPELCETAAELALAGSTDEEIATALGINVATLYRWKGRHELFREALKWGKENCVADERVERSLYARAVGYTYTAVKIFQYEGQPVIVPYKEHVPPDVGAAKSWLINRKKADWSETVRNEVSGVDGAPIEISSVSKLEVARWIAHMLTTGAGAPPLIESKDEEQSSRDDA